MSNVMIEIEGSPEDVLKRHGLSGLFTEFNSADEIIEHYGVMGMHWGARKDAPGGPGYTDETQGKPASAFRKKTSEATKKVAKKTAQVVTAANTRRFDEKDPKALDDAELERRINRLQKEQKYREMNASSVDRGRVIAGAVLKTAGIAAATTLVTAGMIYMGKKGAFKGLSKVKKLGPEKAATLLKDVFPKDKIQWLVKQAKK